MSRKDRAGDVAEYILGVPLFVTVAAVTGAVMAVGFGLITAVDYVLHRGS